MLKLYEQAARKGLLIYVYGSPARGSRGVERQFVCPLFWPDSC
jgi:hypothetical protein